jgi:hypothetical protein
MSITIHYSLHHTDNPPCHCIDAFIPQWKMRFIRIRKITCPKIRWSLLNTVGRSLSSPGSRGFLALEKHHITFILISITAHLDIAPARLSDIRSSLSLQGLRTSMWPGWRILRIWSNRVFECLLRRILSPRFPTPLIVPILSMNRGTRHGPSY